jgi:exopolysaccharide biosynthesis polyprenyl glycosylphosphotransferase
VLRRTQQLRIQIYQLKDATLFMLALWLAHLWRTYVPLDKWFEWLPLIGPVLQQLLSVQIEPFGEFAWLFLVIFPGAPLVLEWQGFYDRPLFCRRRETAWILLKSCAIMTVGVVLVMFFLKVTLARMVILLFGVISFALVMMSEELLRVGYRSRFAQAQLNRRVLLVGAAADTERLRRDLAKVADEGVEVVGELDPNESSIEDLVSLVHQRSPNGVLINAKHTFFGQVEKVIQVCEREGIESWLVADFFQTQLSRTSFDTFYGKPVMVFRSTPEASWQAIAKQLLDVSLAALLLVILSPVLLLTAVAIRVTSPGPILFRQQRCGLNGKPFTMLKFRSMVTDAEQRKHEFAKLNEMAGPVFKLSQDPRVTAVGRLIRRFSIDELPQLTNVLRGEMSLVGPRPLPIDEVERFDDPAHRRRLSVKPGLTCLWQISGRNNVSDFRDWVRLDLEYIDNWSLWLDMKILCWTIPVVITGNGAR